MYLKTFHLEKLVFQVTGMSSIPCKELFHLTLKTKCWQMCILTAFILMQAYTYCASDVLGISTDSLQLTGCLFLSVQTICWKRHSIIKSKRMLSGPSLSSGPPCIFVNCTSPVCLDHLSNIKIISMTRHFFKKKKKPRKIRFTKNCQCSTWFTSDDAKNRHYIQCSSEKSGSSMNWHER